MGGVLAEANRKISDQEADVSEQFAELKHQDAEIENLKSKIQNLESELAERSGENSAPASKDLPEAADLYNQLKAKRKKSTATLGDVEKILEILEGDDKN